MKTLPYQSDVLSAEPLPVSYSALDAAYILNSQLSVKVVTLLHPAAKLMTFSSRKTIGEAADEAAKELGCFMPTPTFVDPSGHIHRRETSMVCMINGETVQLANID